jgi:hypothetical protein
MFTGHERFVRPLMVQTCVVVFKKLLSPEPVRTDHLEVGCIWRRCRGPQSALKSHGVKISE